jgi:hypothetical protein
MRQIASNCIDALTCQKIQKLCLAAEAGGSDTRRCTIYCIIYNHQIFFRVQLYKMQDSCIITLKSKRKKSLPCWSQQVAELSFFGARPHKKKSNASEFLVAKKTTTTEKSMCSFLKKLMVRKYKCASKMT